MEKAIKSTYWLILVVMVGTLLLLGLIPGESYANMRSEAVWQTGLQTSATKISADYLKEGGQIVILKDLTQTRTIELMFSTNRENVSGTLSYSVSPKNAVSVQAPETVNATAAGTTASLILTPAAVSQDTPVVLSIRWTAWSGEVLTGNFHFTIPAQAGNQAQTQPVQSAVPGVEISAIAQFVPGTAIPVTVAHPVDCEQIVLSLAGENFPAGTRYATEYDQQEVLLYDPAPISVQTENGKQTTVLITLPVERANGTVALRADILGPDYAISVQTQATSIGSALELPETYFYAITDGSSFTAPFPGGWSGCTLSYTVQLLTQTSQGITFETTANTSSKGLSVISNGNGINVSLTGKDMPAGTYRLLLVWNYQTYTIAQREVTFHISYPERSTIQTGGNVA